MQEAQEAQEVQKVMEVHDCTTGGGEAGRRWKVQEVQEVATCTLAPPPLGQVARARSPGRPASQGPARAREDRESGGNMGSLNLPQNTILGKWSGGR